MRWDEFSATLAARGINPLRARKWVALGKIPHPTGTTKGARWTDAHVRLCARLWALERARAWIDDATLDVGNVTDDRCAQVFDATAGGDP